MSKQHSHKLWLWGHHAVETALVNPNRQHYQCYVTGDERAMLQKYPALKGIPLRIVDQKDI